MPLLPPAPRAPLAHPPVSSRPSAPPQDETAPTKPQLSSYRTTANHLLTRYQFLSRIYQYHSAVEDGFIYPTLERQVPNVTSNYSLEHDDEGRLLAEVIRLLETFLRSSTIPSISSIRNFVVKAEQVHTTVTLHLAKEEEQLLPLLIRHIAPAEQARLIAHFFDCVPVGEAPAVFSWLTGGLSLQVISQYRDSINMELRRPQPRSRPATHAFGRTSQDESRRMKPVFITPAVLDLWLMGREDVEAADEAAGVRGGSASTSTSGKGDVHRGSRGPLVVPEVAGSGLEAVRYVHDAIRATIEAVEVWIDELARELAALLGASPTRLLVTLDALDDNFRLLRQMFLYHCVSEDEVILPALRATGRSRSDTPHEHGHHHHHHHHHHHNHGQGGDGNEEDVDERVHATEADELDSVLRSLGEARLHVRRGTAQARELVAAWINDARAQCISIKDHMRSEEQVTFPELAAGLDGAAQRNLAWQTVSAMPLDLLGRMLPIMGSTLGPTEVERFKQVMTRSAGPRDGPLVDTLARLLHRTELVSRMPAPQDYAHDKEVDIPASGKRRATVHTNVDNAKDSSMRVADENPGTMAPIDHIFQFHAALRLELRTLVNEAMGILDVPAGTKRRDAVKRLDGHFQFLWSIYHAHSLAEDEIVFPALEGKEHLLNVSKSYAIDHEAEERLFVQMDGMLKDLLRRVSTAAVDEGDESANTKAIVAVQGMCASILASVDTHVRSEEACLWPLFVEYFSIEEQRGIVSSIIGRTGAEVLGTMLPWVQQALPDNEKAFMMEELRAVTKNTRFDRWLGTVMGRASLDDQSRSGTNTQDSSIDKLREVAAYLTKRKSEEEGPSPSTPADEKIVMQNLREPSGVVEVTTTEQLGWGDLFRMNQRQLEAAVRRMSQDPELDEERRAYLIQHLMTARYIVAQQARLMSSKSRISSGGSSFATKSTDDASLLWVAELENVVINEGVEGGAVHEGTTETNMDSGELGCSHYQRKARLVAPCCDKVYTCRFCHDNTESHEMDRYAVKEMVCMLCRCRGPVGQKCASCASSVASYYCDVCHLLDDSGENIYHCPFCNVCRRGKGLGIDFFHCMKCNSCMSITLQSRHACREGALESAHCPVCGDALFESCKPVKELQCGHFMHQDCFSDHVKYSYTCPVCKKSALDMKLYYDMIDAILKSEKDSMPAAYRGRKSKIFCNDCGQKGEADFHFVYHKCPSCSGYNTALR